MADWTRCPLPVRMPLNTDLSVAWQDATRHFDAARYDEAVTACDHLIRQAPDQPMAYSLMSKIWHRQGRVRPATRAAFHASELPVPTGATSSR